VVAQLAQATTVGGARRADDGRSEGVENPLGGA
jgi:hypothetical protein